MKTLIHFTPQLRSLIALLIVILFSSCANDVDPGLRAKKAKLERNIAALQGIIFKSASELARLKAADAMGMGKPGDDQIIQDNTAEIAIRSGQLAKDTAELITVNQEIHRQEMIAPNLLVDVMSVKHFDTSNPNIFSHSPSTGNMTPTVCFVAGTPVHTPGGAREIQDIRAGDSVLSFNELSGKVEPARVTKVLTGKRDDLMVLSTPHGRVMCSQNHRFLTAESRWTMASALSASDKVLALGTGFTGVVPMKLTARHKNLAQPVTVHNFEVEGNHNYFVGPDALLSHNSKGH